MPFNSDEASELTDREHVRSRPAMYIGDTSECGLHNLARAIISHSFWESKSGAVTLIRVTLTQDGSIAVEDDGQGIAVEPLTGLSARMGREVTTLEAVMTLLNPDPVDLLASSRWARKADSCWFLPPALVNILSSHCVVTVRRDRNAFRQAYRSGLACTPVEDLGQTDERGFHTVFRPDAGIMNATEFDSERLRTWLKQMSMLNPGVRVQFVDERQQSREEHCSHNGLLDYLASLNTSRRPLHDELIHSHGACDGIHYEVAFQYFEDTREIVHSFVNDVASFGFPVDPTHGGTHVKGFRSALRDSLESFRHRHAENFPVDLMSRVSVMYDFTEGIGAVVSVRVDEPRWENAMRSQLGNDEVEYSVYAAMTEYLDDYWEKHPETACQIMMKALRSASIWRRKRPLAGNCTFDLPIEDAGSSGAKQTELIVMPTSVQVYYYRANGGRILTPTGYWFLLPLVDEDEGREEQAHVIQTTMAARQLPLFPKQGIVIGKNNEEHLLVLLPSDGDCPLRYRDEIYGWNPSTGELFTVADDLADCEPQLPRSTDHARRW